MVIYHVCILALIASIDCKILQFEILKKSAYYLNLYLRIASYVIEQLTYNSSSSENDIQTFEHDSKTSSDVQDVALPTKKQKMDLKAKKKVDAAMCKTKFQSLWKG